MNPALAGALAKKVGGVIAGYAMKHPVISSIGATYLGGKVLGKIFDGDGNEIKPKRKKGLTYSEIRGAVKVLKLVRRFTTVGRRAVLRSGRR